MSRYYLAQHPGRVFTREELEGRAKDIFGWHAEGKLKARVGLSLPLEKAADAHRALEGRQTTGKVVLTP